MTEDIIRIKLEGVKNMSKSVLEVTPIKISSSELTLNDVRIGRVGFGSGEEGVVVVEDGDAALGLDKIEREECNERGAKREARGRGRESGVQGETGAGDEDGKADGRNVEIAFRKEIQGHGIKTERRGQGEDIPAEGKGKDRTGVAKIKSRQGHGESAEESGDGPERKRFGHGKGVEIVHVDGDEEFTDVARKYGWNGEEEFPGSEGRTIDIDSGRETAEGGDARNEIDGESDEKGSESRGDGANLGT